MKQGPIEKKIIQDCYRTGRPLPDAIQNAPQLLMGLEFFFDAYLDLNSSRYTDMSYIPWEAVKNYCEHYEIDQDMMDDLFYYVQVLDDVRYAYLKKKQDQSDELTGLRSTNQTTRKAG